MPDLVKSITELSIHDIQVQSRLREVSEAAVEALINLIEEFGQTTPILVRKKKSGFFLVDGMHRLEASKRAGLTTIPVRVYEMTDDDASLLEASQNLVGGMTPLDDAVFLAAWKRAHLHKHPETAGGIAGGLARQGQQTNSSSFAEIVAAKRSISVRQVQKIIRAGETLGLQTIRLRHAPRPVTLKDLLDLAKIGDHEERIAIIDAMVDGQAKTAGEARRFWKAKQAGVQPTIKDPVEASLKSLVAIWSRMSDSTKRRFIASIEPEAAKLLTHIRDAKIINLKLGKSEDDESGDRVLAAHARRVGGGAE